MSDTISNHLLPGEKVVWTGSPGAGLILRPIEIFLIPFSLFWGGFALFWNIQVWMTDAPLEFKLFGIPFLVMGVYVILGRFLVDIAVRKSITYAVTDQRILISRSGWSRSVKSLDLARLPAIELQEKANGTGSIRFGAAQSFFANNGFGIWSPAFDATPQFQHIENARSVYQLIQRTIPK